MIEVDMHTFQIIASIVALLIAIIGHEIAHGYAALHYGDKTAKLLGRLSINPFVHIDLFGSILVPGLLYVSGAPFLFGWAKPVPINNRKVFTGGGFNGLSAVASAGIVYNLALALLSGFLLQWANFPDWAMVFLAQLLLVNVVLAVFNAWPIPPLDGSWILSYQFSRFGILGLQRFYERIGNYGMLVLVAVLAFEPLRSVFFAPALWLLELLA
ncbi:MAG: site-2 protease family protein [Helicobacter sp.]|nr:site-2 protease family protein [Helicobacter sp.]